MSQIKVKNFGPIKAGLLENDGFIDVRKVTIFGSSVCVMQWTGVIRDVTLI